MAHFAKLDINNIVLEVLVVNNETIENLPFPESEPIGIAFLENLFGVEEGITWKQTSYNNNFRFRYAGVGYTYDPQRDVFIPPKNFPSWVFNEEKMMYEAPIPYPRIDNKFRVWDEASLSWVEIERPV